MGSLGVQTVHQIQLAYSMVGIYTLDKPYDQYQRTVQHNRGNRVRKLQQAHCARVHEQQQSHRTNDESSSARQEGRASRHGRKLVVDARKLGLLRRLRTSCESRAKSVEGNIGYIIQ